MKTQISLGIRPVWSESSLCTQWVAKVPSFLQVDSDNPDQTGGMPRLTASSLGAHAILLVLSWGGSPVGPATTQVNLGFHPVFVVSFMGSYGPKPSSDGQHSDQTERILRLIWLRWAHRPFCRFCCAQAFYISTSIGVYNATKNIWTPEKIASLSQNLNSIILTQFCIKTTVQVGMVDQDQTARAPVVSSCSILFSQTWLSK